MALDVARAVKAGTVWINCTNLFDAASGFGGYRESGFGREGGREGLYEYLRLAWAAHPTAADGTPAAGREAGDAGTPLGIALPLAVDASANGSPQGSPAPTHAGPVDSPLGIPPIDRTPKMFIGGKQARPDSGYSLPVVASDGRLLGEVGEGNRKDIRNAVEAAHAAAGWAALSAHGRAQILYYLAENLAVRAVEFAARLAEFADGPGEEAALAAGRVEVDATIERLFTYAAWADKFDGAIHGTPLRGVTLAVPEPIGVIGIACADAYPLLGFVSLVAPAIAMGNTVVAVPSPRYPLAAADLYQVLETSDLPAGTVNIVTGERAALARVLAEHDDVDAVWYAGPPEGIGPIEAASAGNMKRTWMPNQPPRDWFDSAQGEGPEFLRQATQVKNIWVPSGD
jgi:aldehyde dehydrogenase (NAD+)